MSTNPRLDAEFWTLYYVEMSNVQYQEIKELHIAEIKTFESLYNFLKIEIDLEQPKLRKYLLSEIVVQLEIIVSKLQ
ncbi:hypothetical protein [Leptospira interrogans]|uniref:hypothetical protein n=1 Tax=Leptospira interrogans TaxID=173 RepID=UPI0007739AB0|nr:hypothetical protein [Leptospira interrogans]